MYSTFGLALLLLQSGVVFNGEVRLDGKQPANQVIRVELLQRGGRVAESYADSAGRFSFTGIPVGPYELVVSCNGQVAAEQPVNVMGNSGDVGVRVLLETHRPATNGEYTRSAGQLREPSKRVTEALRLSGRFIKEKRYADAERLLKDTIRKSPLEGDAYFALALVHFEQGNWLEAISIGSQAHDRYHQKADVHLLLAKSHAKLGNEAAVTSELKIFISEAPNGPAKTASRKVLEMLSEKP